MQLSPLSNLLLNHCTSNKPVVLVYHSICSNNSLSDSPWELPLDIFKSHLDLIQQQSWGTQCISNFTTNAAAKTIYITFDDGYENNYPAFEQLLERGMKASCFVVSGSIGQIQNWRDDGLSPQKLLSISQIRDLYKNGIEIGSHSVNHEDLPKLNDIELKNEVSHSKQQLEDMLGEAITSFAYPYGRWDERVIECAKAENYSVGCTTRSGWAMASQDPFKLHRITVYANDKKNDLAKKIALCTNSKRNREVINYFTKRLFKHFKTDE